MLSDWMWWIATTDLVLMGLATLFVASLAVAHLPLVGRLPVIAPYAALAVPVSYLSLALLSLFAGFRLADERAETQRLKNELQWSNWKIEQQEKTVADAEELKAAADARAKDRENELDRYRSLFADNPLGPCAWTDEQLQHLERLRSRNDRAR